MEQRFFIISGVLIAAVMLMLSILIYQINKLSENLESVGTGVSVLEETVDEIHSKINNLELHLAPEEATPTY